MIKENYAPRSSTSLSARPFSQMSGALPVVGEAVKLATGRAGTRMGERFFKKTIRRRMKSAGVLPLPFLFLSHYFGLFPPASI